MYQAKETIYAAPSTIAPNNNIITIRSSWSRLSAFGEIKWWLWVYIISPVIHKHIQPKIRLPKQQQITFITTLSWGSAYHPKYCTIREESLRMTFSWTLQIYLEYKTYAPPRITLKQMISQKEWTKLLFQCCVPYLRSISHPRRIISVK